jgi:peroxiredoxin (alkyl hydroperoxide reductase subunit C)
LTAVAVKYPELKNLGVEVLSMSVDSIFVHKIWQQNELSKMVEGGVPYPMLSDPGGNIGEVYEVYDAESRVNIRGQFIIDPDGVLQAMEILAPAVGRNVDELVRQMKAFQKVRESKGKKATPAGWQPGQAILKPGPDLVGKVFEQWKPAKTS